MSEVLYVLTLPHLALPVLGAALAVGLSGFGSATGISIAGQVADGVLAEDPDIFGRVLIFVAMPGTQGIYGFLGAFLILLKAGIIGGAPDRDDDPDPGMDVLFCRTCRWDWADGFRVFTKVRYAPPVSLWR